MTSPHEVTDGNETGSHALAEHHRTLGDRLARLIARAQGGDPPELRAAWTAFERELLRHLELEETEILPAFAREDPREARTLLEEHEAIRRAMLEMGLTLDLHCLRTEGVEELVRMLKVHAAREDAALYGWAQRHVASDTWQTIKRGLKEAAKVGASGLAHLANSFM